MVDIAILDFGGQYVFNIKRVLIEQGIDADIFPYDIKANDLKRKSVRGIILSGGPYSICDKDAPKVDPKILDLGIPILGICYGHQLLAQLIGGKVAKAEKCEYGFSILKINRSDILFEGLGKEEICWMSHSDEVIRLPKGAIVLASTEDCKIAAFKFKNFYGVQFHPEVSHTPKGYIILRNFAIKICKCKPKKWNIKEFIDKKIEEIRETVRNNYAICAVSGGIDSTVCAYLAYKALGNKLICVHVNTGLMRKNECEEVISNLRKLGLNVLYIDATNEFLNKLKNISNFDKKRKVIGNLFIKIFEKVAEKYKTKFFIQGTIAPDVIESSRGESKKRIGSKHGGLIKIHHNVGGLPKDMKLIKIEPLRELFKYQVRILAKYLNIPNYFVNRQPFPGPGLACRIIDDVTKEKLDIVREANYIVEKHLKKYRPSQYFAYLFNNRYKRNRDVEYLLKKEFDFNVISLKFFDDSIGVKGDERCIGKMVGLLFDKNDVYKLNYIDILKIQSKITGKFKDIVRVLLLINFGDGKYNIAIRAVNTLDFMTAIPTNIKIKDLMKLADEIKSIDKKIGCVCYDITTKPPATIEVV